MDGVTSAPTPSPVIKVHGNIHFPYSIVHFNAEPAREPLSAVHYTYVVLRMLLAAVLVVKHHLRVASRSKVFQSDIRIQVIPWNFIIIRNFIGKGQAPACPVSSNSSRGYGQTLCPV